MGASSPSSPMSSTYADCDVMLPRPSLLAKNSTSMRLMLSWSGKFCFPKEGVQPLRRYPVTRCMGTQKSLSSSQNMWGNIYLVSREISSRGWVGSIPSSMLLRSYLGSQPRLTTRPASQMFQLPSTGSIRLVMKGANTQQPGLPLRSLATTTLWGLQQPSMSTFLNYHSLSSLSTQGNLTSNHDLKDITPSSLALLDTFSHCFLRWLLYLIEPRPSPSPSNPTAAARRGLAVLLDCLAWEQANCCI